MFPTFSSLHEGDIPNSPTNVPEVVLGEGVAFVSRAAACITKLQLLSVSLSVCLSVCPFLGNAHWNVNWYCPKNVVLTVPQG